MLSAGTRPPAAARWRTLRPRLSPAQAGRPARRSLAPRAISRGPAGLPLAESVGTSHARPGARRNRSAAGGGLLDPGEAGTPFSMTATSATATPPSTPASRRAAPRRLGQVLSVVSQKGGVGKTAVSRQPRPPRLRGRGFAHIARRRRSAGSVQLRRRIATRSRHARILMTI